MVIRRPIMARSASLLAALLLPMLPACSHIKGVVVDERNRPVASAILSIGRPGSIGVFEPHKVDARGRFDFQVSPLDSTNVFLYDGAGDPQATLRQIDQNDLSDHMQLLLHRAAPGAGEDFMAIPPGITP